MEPICGISPQTVREYNTRLAQLYSLYMNFTPRALDAETVETLAADCDIPAAEAFAHCLAAYFDLDAARADRLFFRHWLLPSIEEQVPTLYTEDAYFKNIKIPQHVRGKWALKEEFLAPYEPFVCRDFKVLPDGRMLPQIAFFKEKYPFPAVLENGREWMTLQPNEMVTTWPAIGKARGRVLTFGMGLGYFTYHAAEKPEVESVTVVDISDDVLALFREYILPQFPHKEKVKLVKKDAFTFAEEDMAGNFDFVFADIWHDAGDGLELYARMRRLEELSPQTEFAYWIEDSLLCQLRRIISAELDSGDGAMLRNYSEVAELLTDNSLRELAKSLQKA